MAKILAPNKHYTGVSAGIGFVNGQGETTDINLIEWFKSKGYTVAEEAGAPDAPAASAPVITEEVLKAMSRDELVNEAKKYEIDQPQKVSNEKLVAAILEQSKK